MFLSFKTHTANHTGRDSRCAPVLPSLPSNPGGFYVSREGQYITDLIHPTNFRKKTKVGFLIAIKWLIHFAVFSCFMALRWLPSPSRSQKQACGFRGMPAAAEGVLNKGTPRLSLLLLFSHSIVSCSLWSHGLQHARLPCPSPSPRVCSDSCPLSRWCHPTISSSAAPFTRDPGWGWRAAACWDHCRSLPAGLPASQSP